MPDSETAAWHRWARAAVRFVVAFMVFFGLKALGSARRPLLQAVATKAGTWSRVSTFGPLAGPMPRWFDFPRRESGPVRRPTNRLWVRENFGWHTHGTRAWFVPGVVVQTAAGGRVESLRGGQVSRVRRTAAGWAVTMQVAPGLRLALSGLAGVRLQTGTRIRPGAVVGTAGTHPFTVQAWDQGYPVNPHLAHVWIRVKIPEGAG